MTPVTPTRYSSTRTSYSPSATEPFKPCPMETSSGSLANSCARDSPAQLYVALSRSWYPPDPIQGRCVRVFVTDFEGLQGKISGQTDVYTRNVACKEILA